MRTSVMYFSPTFSLYIIRKLLINLFYIFLIFAFISFITDFLELIRDSQGKKILLEQMFKISLYKVPFISYSFLPFIFLFGSILTFTKLNNNFEFAAAKSVGISIWSICVPITIVTLLLSLLILWVFQPISAVLLDNNRILMAKYLDRDARRVSLQSNGIWLYDQTDNFETTKIIMIRHIDKHNIFSNVTVYSSGMAQDFASSYVAETASLEPGKLMLHNTKKYTPGKEAEYFSTMTLSTDLSKDQIQESIPNPDIIQFWSLSDFINKIKLSGFSTLKHDLYYQSMLASPLLYISLVLIGLACSINLPRKGKLGVVFVTGAVIGIIIFFINKMANVMALTGLLPLTLAVIAPSVSYILISGVILIHCEEG